MSDLVAMTVATAFAASWKPLLKPNKKPSATRTTVAEVTRASGAIVKGRLARDTAQEQCLEEGGKSVKARELRKFGNYEFINDS